MTGAVLDAVSAGPGQEPSSFSARQPTSEVAGRAEKGEGTVAEAVRAGLTASVIRVLDHEPGVRAGQDPEAVHQARVGTRRLRADLRAARPVLNPDWADGLRGELKGFARRLGTVRDADVMLARLRSRLVDLSSGDAEAAAELVARLETERDDAQGRLTEYMETTAHADLLDRLVEAARAPAMGAGGDRPAAEVVPGLVAPAWDALEAAVGTARQEGATDADRHQARIRTKRCRYGGLMAAVAVGKPARRLASRLGDLQDVLGEVQDAVVTEAWLRQAAGVSPALALAAGQMIAAERAAAGEARSAWPKAWKRAAKPKATAWLRR